MNRHHDEPLDPQALRSEDPLDREIGQALAELPRERAAAGFTEQVLRRLDETPSDRFRWQPVLAGAAVAAAVVAVLLAAGVLRPASTTPESPGAELGPELAAANDPEDPASSETQSTAVSDPEPNLSRRAPSRETRVAHSARPRSETGAMLEELRREHARLTRDLRDLRELAEGAQVLYVGGDESLDFVLDLASETVPGGGPDVRPASLQRPGPGDGLRFF